jgi:hypothetical protein
MVSRRPRHAPPRRCDCSTPPPRPLLQRHRPTAGRPAHDDRHRSSFVLEVHWNEVLTRRWTSLVAERCVAVVRGAGRGVERIAATGGARGRGRRETSGTPLPGPRATRGPRRASGRRHYPTAALGMWTLSMRPTVAEVSLARSRTTVGRPAWSATGWYRVVKADARTWRGARAPFSAAARHCSASPRWPRARAAARQRGQPVIALGAVRGGADAGGAFVAAWTRDDVARRGGTRAGRTAASVTRA